MELQHIKALLTLYLEGKTNLEEEKQLRNYFSRTNVPLELEEYHILFGFYAKEKEEKFTKKIVLPSKKRNLATIFKIAATLLFFAGATTFFIYQNNNQNEDLGTFQSPKEAKEATQKALQQISTNLNIGMKNARYINEYEKQKEKVFPKEER